ncbi:hypothetical protein RRG08_023295 [Elysia crispata]|uniref:Uncharacterized protein n=1 Tax=Elysia crispata TaxID=231223 RepID=A0AAE1BE63_9GAST|nr:hypothetical protein RRG08_023295 [Elysia crispata]
MFAHLVLMLAPVPSQQTAVTAAAAAGAWGHGAQLQGTPQPWLATRGTPNQQFWREDPTWLNLYGKIQSVKLQAAKDNGGTGTATVAFNDIKSAAKAHHANNSLGETTLRTDYWEGSAQTPVLVASAPPLGAASSTGGSSARGVAPSGSSYANPPATRPVSSFASWAKGESPVMKSVLMVSRCFGISGAAETFMITAQMVQLLNLQK